MTADILTYASNREHQRGFNSHKCTDSIVYTNRCSRDALIQATLDPDVDEIFPAKAGNTQFPSDAFFCFGVSLRQSRCLLVLCHSTNGINLDIERFDLTLCVGRDTILAEPALSAARTIWSKREALVPPRFSHSVLRKLESQTSGAMHLRELESIASDESEPWLDYIFALATRGQISIDFRRPVGPESRVSLTPRASQRRRHWLD